jgi:hypothetical protein
MPEIIAVGLAVATVAFGVIAVTCPRWAVLHSREDNDRSPPTAGEIWFIRVVGAGAFLGGVYGLYAMLTGMQGAQAPPLP